MVVVHRRCFVGQGLLCVCSLGHFWGGGGDVRPHTEKNRYSSGRAHTLYCPLVLLCLYTSPWNCWRTKYYYRGKVSSSFLPLVSNVCTCVHESFNSDMLAFCTITLRTHTGGEEEQQRARVQQYWTTAMVEATTTTFTIDPGGVFNPSLPLLKLRLVFENSNECISKIKVPRVLLRDHTLSKYDLRKFADNKTKPNHYFIMPP